MQDTLSRREFSTAQKIIYTLLGALITGAMWRARGSHGWGSEWGVYTVGMVFLIYVYAVFRRKTNASFFTVVAAGCCCMMTVPAWGTLLNQTSGYFEAHAISETAACSPLSGVFIMLCLGFGMLPLYMFILSRLFSDKQYSLISYIIIAATFFGVFYLASATIAHPILNLVQPESAEAFGNALKTEGIGDGVYKFYMAHFSQINAGKKIPYGRNYFTEIAVIAHAIAALAMCIVQRFALKDRFGSLVSFFGCLAFAIGNTLANSFFVMKNKIGVEKLSFLDSAWSFWEYFTGFITALILMIALFAIHKKCEDKGFSDNLIPQLPEKAKDIFMAVFVYGFGFAFALLRPFATRLDESDVFPIIVYAIGGLAALAVLVLMFLGKLPKMWKADPTKNAQKLCAFVFILNMIYYMFVGYTAECPPHILDNDGIQKFMVIAVPITIAGYLITDRKEIFAKKQK